MAAGPIFDSQALAEDLRLVVAYAAKAGVLQDRALLESLDGAGKALTDPASGDLRPVVTALNEAARAIAPMTVADLRFGRDPFTEANQRKSRILQFWLTFLSLMLLLFIGHFMHALHQEQEALVTLEQIQSLNPQQKLTALRKMAQWERPLNEPSTLYDQYHQKVGELVQINGRVVTSYTSALAAANLPLFPLGDLFSNALFDRLGARLSTPLGNEAPPPAPVATASGAGAGAGAAESATATATAAVPVVLEAGPRPEDICAVDDSGQMRLPTDSVNYPQWLQAAVRDALTDFCFQVKVVTPGGGELSSQSLSRLSFVSRIKEKVSLRVNWFLPFLYGLLGSAVFMMRNVASVRTPAVDWFPVVMRIALGGVAGIVIGWFWSADLLGLKSTSTLSLPFALAFLTGYGIDVLFTLLDRFNRSIGTVPSARA